MIKLRSAKICSTWSKNFCFCYVLNRLLLPSNGFCTQLMYVIMLYETWKVRLLFITNELTCLQMIFKQVNQLSIRITAAVLLILFRTWDIYIFFPVSFHLPILIMHQLVMGQLKYCICWYTHYSSDILWTQSEYIAVWKRGW